MHWKTLSKQRLHSDKWQDITLNTFSTPNGITGTYVAVNKYHDSAAIIARNNHHEVALISVYRYVIDEEVWQVPLEAIEQNEDPMQAAKRGAKEELGVWPQTIEKIGEFYPDPGMLKQKATVYELTDLEPLHDEVTHEVLEQEMIVSIQWFSLEKIEEMITNRQVKDGWTLSALHLYKNHGR